MMLSIFLKNFSLVRTILFIAVVALGIWAIVEIIYLIPENLDIVGSWGTIFWKIQDFLTAFTKIMYPFSKITELVVGGYVGIQPKLFSISTLWILLSVLGVIIVCLGLAFLISKPLFFKMASKPFEYRKITLERNNKNRKTKECRG